MKPPDSAFVTRHRSHCPHCHLTAPSGVMSVIQPHQHVSSPRLPMLGRDRPDVPCAFRSGPESMGVSLTGAVEGTRLSRGHADRDLVVPCTAGASMAGFRLGVPSWPVFRPGVHLPAAHCLGVPPPASSPPRKKARKAGHSCATLLRPDCATWDSTENATAQ